MLLTRKASSTALPQPRLARGLSGVLAKTMDRRAFLKRSGITVGAGAVACELPFSMIGQAEAKSDLRPIIGSSRRSCHPSSQCSRVSSARSLRFPGR